MPSALFCFAWRQDVSICYEVNVFAWLKRYDMNYVVIKSDNVIVHGVKAGMGWDGAGVGPRLGCGRSGGVIRSKISLGNTVGEFFRNIF
jgi:hypothetical protein